MQTQQTREDSSPRESWRESQHMSQSRLRDIRVEAKRNLSFFAREILEYSDVVKEPWRFHQKMCNFVADDSKKRRMFLISRGFLKTSLVTIADTIHRFVKCLPDLPNPREKPDYDQTVLLVGPNVRRARTWIQDIRNTVEESETLQAVFPDLEPKYTEWTADHISFVAKRNPRRRASHIECVGAGSSATGSHQTIVKYDDIVDNKNVATADLRDKMANYYRSMQPIHAKKQEGAPLTEFIVGTPYHFDDLYATLIREQHHYFMRQSCWGEDGHSIYPELYPDDWLFEQREIMGATMFAAQYECDPAKITKETLFRDDWLRYYEVLPEGTVLDVVGVVDPSTGAKHGDPAGIVVAGEAQNGDVYVLHSEGRNYATEDLAERMVYLNKVFRPRVWLVESNGTQANMRPVIDRKRRENPIFMRVLWTGSETMLSKQQRIQDLSQRFEQQQPLDKDIEKELTQRKIYLRSADMELRKQLRYYGKMRRDDVVDAFAYSHTLFTRNIRVNPLATRDSRRTFDEVFDSGDASTVGGFA